MPAQEYDVVVIGAGSTGENVADRATKRGLRAVVVESELVGGDCSYWACMPTKALLRPLDAFAAARRVAGAREAVTGRPDVAAILARRDEFTSHWRDAGQAEWLRSVNVDLVRGRGRLAGERRVGVTGNDDSTTELRARQAVVICTGSRAAIPPIPGLAETRPWTSREAASAKAAPRRLAILGGGVVATEMACIWKQLGVEELTVIERGPRLLSKNEPFAGELLKKALEERGVSVLTTTTAERVERTADGAVRLALSNGSAIIVDQVLAATGRQPRTQDIGLETVGLKPGNWLEVDESMRVKAVPGGWLYAAGDVNHRALLTHMGKYQARICGDAIAARAAGEAEATAPAPWSRFAATADHEALPQVIFTDPEVAAVGLTEEQAKERGLKVRVADYDIGRIAGASVYADGYEGRARLVVDEARGVIVGATLVGPAVGELIHAATIAVAGGVSIDRLRHAVPSFPTISETWLRLLEELGA